MVSKGYTKARVYACGGLFADTLDFVIVRFITLGKHCHGYEIMLRRLVGADKGAAPPRFFSTGPVMILAGAAESKNG